MRENLRSSVTPGRSEVSCPDRIPDGRCPDAIDVAKNVVRTVQTLSGQTARPSGHVRTSAEKLGQNEVAGYFRCVRPKTSGRTNVRTFSVRPDMIEVAFGPSRLCSDKKPIRPDTSELRRKSLDNTKLHVIFVAPVRKLSDGQTSGHFLSVRT